MRLRGTEFNRRINLLRGLGRFNRGLALIGFRTTGARPAIHCFRVRSFGVIRVRISDPRSIWIMGHQRNRRIHSGHGFAGSFDAPWWRQILDHWSELGSPQRNALLVYNGYLSQFYPGNIQSSGEFRPIARERKRTTRKHSPVSVTWCIFRERRYFKHFWKFPSF